MNYIDGSAIIIVLTSYETTYIDLKCHVKMGNRILFVDYAVRQWLQTVNEGKKKVVS